MRVLVELWRSTVGRKALAAVSGLLLSAWVVLHAGGNLTLFRGAAVSDGYAATLRDVPAALWAVRLGLVAAAVVHVAAVTSLARVGRSARPRHVARTAPRTSTLAARSMRVGGVLLLTFVVYHVLHLTLGLAHPGFQPGRVYDNVVVGLRPAGVAAVYVGAAALLGLHLFHGLWATGVSLGLRLDAGATRRRPLVAALSAAAIALGFASVPLGVLVGWLR
jgi:succinate dehydrogenase / fumarate reductase cytochrome b subunit